MIFQQLFSMNFGGIPSWIIVEIPLLLKGGVAGHFPCMNENCERGKRSYLKSVVQLWLINVMARVVRWASEILGALSSSTSLIWLGISRILVIQWVCPFTSRFFSLHFEVLAARSTSGPWPSKLRHKTSKGLCLGHSRWFYVICPVFFCDFSWPKKKDSHNYFDPTLASILPKRQNQFGVWKDWRTTQHPLSECQKPSVMGPLIRVLKLNYLIFGGSNNANVR